MSALASSAALASNMDEAAFILDYVMPPGSSRRKPIESINHVENIIKQIPEVENTSRPHRVCSWDLPLSPEPNTGDIAVKLRINAAATLTILSARSVPR